MRRDTSKLRRVDDKLYEEVRGADERPFKWEKQYEVIELELTDVELTDAINLDFAGISRWSKENRFLGESAIKATGLFANDTISIIASGEGEPSRFDRADVFIRSARDWNALLDDFNDSEKDIYKVLHFGALRHVTSRDLEYADRDVPHLTLDLTVPTNEFYRLLDRLTAKQAQTRIIARADVPFFRSEVDRSLEEWYHPRSFFIENGSSQPAYPTRIEVKSQPIKSIENGNSDLDPNPKAKSLIGELTRLNLIGRILAALLILIALILAFR